MTISEIPHVTDQLSKLERLRSERVISDSEFERLKAKLIADTVGAADAPSAEEQPPPKKYSPALTKLLAIDRIFSQMGTVLTVFGIIAVVGLFVFPMLMEGVTGPCAAVESKYYRQYLGSDGAYTEALVKAFYRDTPPALSCSLIYYGQIKAPGY
jgi:hypothetical protein